MVQKEQVTVDTRLRRPRLVTQFFWERARGLPATDLGQRLVPIEHSDVLGLNWRETPDCPGQVHKVRLVRHGKGRHTALVNEPVPLPGVTRRARRQHVRPVIRSPTRERNEVITSQILTGSQGLLTSSAKLTGVAVTGKEKRVRDLTTEFSWHVNKPRQPDDGGPGKCEVGATDKPSLLRFDDDGFAINDQAKRPSHWNQRERFERRIERQAAR